jgi:hypothetical protein
MHQAGFVQRTCVPNKLVVGELLLEFVLLRQGIAVDDGGYVLELVEAERRSRCR